MSMHTRPVEGPASHVEYLANQVTNARPVGCTIPRILPRQVLFQSFSSSLTETCRDLKLVATGTFQVLSKTSRGPFESIRFLDMLLIANLKGLLPLYSRFEMPGKA